MVVVRRAAAGKATEDDATFLAVASRDALDGEGVGAVAFKGGFVLPFPFPFLQREAQFGGRVADHESGVSSRVMLKKGDGVLVAVFKDV